MLGSNLKRVVGLGGQPRCRSAAASRVCCARFWARSRAISSACGPKHAADTGLASSELHKCVATHSLLNRVRSSLHQPLQHSTFHCGFTHVLIVRVILLVSIVEGSQLVWWHNPCEILQQHWLRG